MNSMSRWSLLPWSKLSENCQKCWFWETQNFTPCAWIGARDVICRRQQRSFIWSLSTKMLPSCTFLCIRGDQLSMISKNRFPNAPRPFVTKFDENIKYLIIPKYHQNLLKKQYFLKITRFLKDTKCLISDFLMTREFWSLGFENLRGFIICEDERFLWSARVWESALMCGPSL